MNVCRTPVRVHLTAMIRLMIIPVFVSLVAMVTSVKSRWTTVSIMSVVNTLCALLMTRAINVDAIVDTQVLELTFFETIRFYGDPQK